MKTTYEIIFFFRECISAMLASSRIYFFIVILLSLLMGILGFFLGKKLIYLWNKKYFWRKSDYIFLVIFCFFLSLMTISIFSLKFYNDASLSIYNKIWKNEIISDLSWQKNLLNLEGNTPDEESRLLAFSKVSLNELKKKMPYDLFGLDVAKISKSFVKQSIDLINEKNKYYTVNYFQPKDGVKIVGLLIKDNVNQSIRKLLVSVLFVFFSFTMLCLIILSPVMIKSYNEIIVHSK